MPKICNFYLLRPLVHFLWIKWFEQKRLSVSRGIHFQTRSKLFPPLLLWEIRKMLWSKTVQYYLGYLQSYRSSLKTWNLTFFIAILPSNYWQYSMTHLHVPLQRKLVDQTEPFIRRNRIRRKKHPISRSLFYLRWILSR